ncbi:hypothetical protein AAF712_002567 [Marasmius tenuissimus]|uniref:Uncharacterized protein n=1 Tax=Marasmius tenuissimus TaxID=585030 RepID=A0ABR3A906_9AGAR
MADDSAPTYPVGASLNENHEQVHLPRRHPHLPTVFKLDTHPYIPVATRPFIANIYLIFKDLSDEGLSRHREFMKTSGSRAPAGSNMDVCSQGFLSLKPGDILFMRRLGVQDPAKDVIRASVLSDEEIEPWRSSLIEVRDEILGPRELRLPGKPQKSNGEWVGGIAFERNNYLLGIDGSRCYSVGLTHQRTPNAVHPAAENRVSKGDEPGRELRGKLVRIISSVGLHALRTRCPEVLETINNYTDALNLPRLGNPENGAYPGFQVNPANAVSYDSSTTALLSYELCHLLIGNLANTLATDMNPRFGDPHKDEQDASGALSGVCSIPDVPEGYEAGRFHLLEDGVFIELDGVKFANFSGLGHHAGTPPRAPSGQAVVPHAMRLNIIAYPPYQIMNGIARYYIAPSGNKAQPFTLPPEAIRPEYMVSFFSWRFDLLSRFLTRYPLPESQQSTFMTDVHNLMDIVPFATFVGRTGVQVLDFLTRLMPPELNAHFNPSAILNQIKITVDREERSLAAWPSGPTGKRFDPGDGGMITISVMQL